MSWGITIRFRKLFLSERQVAHVLLTRPPLRISVNQYSPFDLHVLGVPPAFVLSQDQTLYDNCISYYPFRQFEILFNNACVITALFLILSLNSSSDFSKEFQGSLLFFFSIVQFSRCLSVISWLIYYITSFSFCQVLFEIFFNFFLDLFSRRNLCHATTYLLYHIFLDLSSTFLNFFQKIFLTSSAIFLFSRSSDSFIIISHLFSFVK